MASKIRAFQIFYDEATRASIDPEFEPLDNSKNERPDWYEYWPIRNYLLQNQLDDSAYYGFLSPNFFEKTHLSGKQVKDFIREAGAADVVTFSPFPCHAACFVNIFEHGDYFHRGLHDVARQFFGEIDPGVDLDALVMHSRNTVFCNFFFAKPRFWNLWKGVLDRMLELVEARTSPLYSPLNKYVQYAKEDGSMTFAPMSVFVMERAVSFLLTTSGAFATKNFPPFELPLSPRFVGNQSGIAMLDALKIAFSETGDAYFLHLFKEGRDQAVEGAWGSIPPPPRTPSSMSRV